MSQLRNKDVESPHHRQFHRLVINQDETTIDEDLILTHLNILQEKPMIIVAEPTHQNVQIAPYPNPQCSIAWEIQAKELTHL